MNAHMDHPSSQLKVDSVHVGTLGVSCGFMLQVCLYTYTASIQVTPLVLTLEGIHHVIREDLHMTHSFETCITCTCKGTLTCTVYVGTCFVGIEGKSSERKVSYSILHVYGL